MVPEKLLSRSRSLCRRAWQDRVSQHNIRPARPRPRPQRTRPRPIFLVSDRSCRKTDGLRQHHWFYRRVVISSYLVTATFNKRIISSYSRWRRCSAAGQTCSSQGDDYRCFWKNTHRERHKYAHTHTDTIIGEQYIGSAKEVALKRMLIIIFNSYGQLSYKILHT